MRLVTASYDGTARVWDAHTGQPLGEPMHHENWVLFAGFSPDGSRIVTTSEDKTARLWDSRRGIPISDPMQHEDRVLSATFSPDGSRIVTASADQNARLWDILPPSNASPPSWLPDLAEAVGGLALSDSGSLDPVDPDKFFQLKEQLADASGDDFWSKVGRWFFADRATRTISPQSTVTFPEYQAREAAAAKNASQPAGH